MLVFILSFQPLVNFVSGYFLIDWLIFFIAVLCGFAEVFS